MLRDSYTPQIGMSTHYYMQSIYVTFMKIPLHA